ncbi:MAG TPA: 30S ribosome-binding factor RbfA [Longimicrobiales bacterium]|nr:30S ribosome-binding factor RbfA [Longimicrobiales bacterium]
MARRRIERLNEQLRRELTEILRREVKDPRVGVVTVMGVRTAPDLTFARVLVEIPSAEDEPETLAGLAAAAPFVRRELGQRLRIRRVPELHFEADHALDHVRRIEELLDEAKDGGGASEDA